MILEGRKKGTGSILPIPNAVRCRRTTEGLGRPQVQLEAILKLSGPTPLAPLNADRFCEGCVTGVFYRIMHWVKAVKTALASIT